MEPFLTVEEKLKELEALVEEPIVLIDGFVKEAEGKIKLAKKSGVSFSAPFFDTYLFVKKLKTAKGWENVELEYLSDYYGIEQQSAHRAYCGAEANMWGYFN